MKLALRRREPAVPEPTPAHEPPGRVPWWRLLRPRRASLVNLVRHNPGLKLLALGLAFFLWFSINVSEHDARRTMEVPVAVRTRPVLAVTDGKPDTVEVTLAGPRSILEGVNEHKTSFTVDLTARTVPGQARVDLKRSMVRPALNRRLDLVAIKPTLLTMTVDRLERRSIPVDAKLIGEPAVGYRIEHVSVVPEQVEVTAPVSRFVDLKKITTDDIDVNGRRDDFQKSVVLAWAGELVNFSPDHVRVEVAFQPAMMSRNFRVDVRLQHGDDVHVKLDPPGVTLTIEGPQALLHNYQLEDGAVWVDLDDLTPGTHKVSVHVNLPPELTVVRKQPDSHTATITSVAGDKK